MKTLGIEIKPFTGKGVWHKASSWDDATRYYYYFESGAVEGEGYFCDYSDAAARWTAQVAVYSEKDKLGYKKTRYLISVMDTCKESKVEDLTATSLKGAKQKALELLSSFIIW